MKYLSVCSGVEAATVAWHQMGWQPVAYSEIEPFPSAVLAHHYPSVPNLGDMTKYKEWKLNESIDLVVGGTPCQSFSVAGLRKGLEDPRGNLMLTYCGILDKFRPQWCVWENVPGVLSSNGGRDFGSLLGALGELGYGFAYRVLDAQHFGVPQRRRRLFLVGNLGDWRSAAKVLFEPESMLGNIKKSRSTGQKTTAFTSSSFGGYGEGVGTIRAAGGDLGGGSETLICSPDGKETTGSLLARDYKGIGNQDLEDGRGLVVYENHPSDSRVKEMGEVCQTVTSTWGTGGGNIPFVGVKAYTLQGGGTTSQNSQGMGWNEDISFTLNSTDVHGVAVAFDSYNLSISDINQTIKSPNGGTLESVGGIVQKPFKKPIDAVAGFLPTQGSKAQGIGYEMNRAPTLRAGCDAYGIHKVVAPTLTASNNPSRSPQSTEVTNQVASVYEASMAVRRLTPVECERLQGFPDNYTQIPWRKKEADVCPDGPRYKAMGNSMAVPVMKWIGQRIQEGVK